VHLPVVGAEIDRALLLIPFVEAMGKDQAAVKGAVKGYLLILNEANEEIPEPDDKSFTTPVDFVVA